MTITIAVTSDLHGRMDKLAQIQTMIQTIKPDILIDNGDFLQGSLSTYYYDFIAKQPHPMLDLANEIGYDVAIFGNHEFNYPLAQVEQMRNCCEFPWIAGNIGDFSQPYFIKHVQHKRVAIIGVTTHFTPFWDEQNLTDSLKFTDAFEDATHWVNYVYTNEQPDYIVLCYHGGFTKDPLTNRIFADDTGENQANDMLTIPHVDALITGHQHLQIATVIDGKPVVQPGANGSCLAVITLGEKPDATLLHTSDEAEYYPLEVKQWLQKKVGTAADDFTYNGLLHTRIHKPKFVDFLHDVQLNATQAELSLVELMYHEQGGLNGDITRYDVLKNISRPNTLKVIALTGANIRLAIEQCAAVFAVNAAGDIDFSFNVYPNELQPYIYDYWGGVDYTLNVSKPIGHRIEELSFKGVPLEDTKTYRVVMNSYRATGVEFPMFHQQHCLFESEQILPAIIMQHIQQRQTIQYISHGTITITT